MTPAKRLPAALARGTSDRGCAPESAGGRPVNLDQSIGGQRLEPGLKLRRLKRQRRIKRQQGLEPVAEIPPARRALKEK
jgi:hypothetical protein